jgi:hypothetical protein
VVAKIPPGSHRHKLPESYRVASKPVLGGLHHEYRLEKMLHDRGLNFRADDTVPRVVDAT